VSKTDNVIFSGPHIELLLLLLLLLLHPYNGLFSWTAWVSRYQNGNTSLDLNEARDVGVYGPITIAIRARFEHDTTSYEELCAFEQ